jgi:hypothetical protein
VNLLIVIPLLQHLYDCVMNAGIASDDFPHGTDL